ncbi:MAG TPA: hypothetical protein PLB25_00600 [Rhodoferax sp.]|nr:hypothetical protein [Rhodoferax sp.]
MIETLLGGLLGGAFRLAPELLKWLDRKGERGHELAMQDKALEFEKIRGASRMGEIGASADAAWNSGAMEAFKEAVSGQGRPSGVKWVDALSSTVRPMVTYLFVLMYAGVKLSTFVGSVQTGMGFGDALLAAWTEADQALLAGILNYWFLNRTIEKGLR